MFPGQGAQKVGMAQDLAQNIPEIAQLFDQAHEILGYDLATLCFTGPEEKLNQTEIAQPALFTASVACLTALRLGIVATELSSIIPDTCIGLSLGEYTALYAAGAVSFENGLRLVQIRGQSMQFAANLQKGAMVSILGLDQPNVDKLCHAVLAEPISEQDDAEPVLVPVNFNCPGQIVLSGTSLACQNAAQRAEEFGATNAIPLNVIGSFHTKLMDPAAKKLRQALKLCPFSLPDCRVIANVDVQPYLNADQISDKLLRQLTNPVLWQQTIEKLLDDGYERFVEIGPGRILSGLLKKTARPRKVRPTMINISGLT